MHRFDTLRVWRRIGGSRKALVVALVATLAAGLFGSGALFISHAFSGNAQAHATKPGRPSKKDEGAWFQLSHFGKSHPSPDARAKALQQAAKMPISRLAPATTAGAKTGTANANLATAGGGWTPLGPVGEDSSTCTNVNWCTGNFGVNSGRVTGMAVNPSNSSEIWVGAADGGLWHSTDGGQHWAPMTDGQTTLSVGSIALDPQNPSTIYVGTGEVNNNGDSYWGEGILKSTDDGATWTLLGASQFSGLGIAKIAVDPHNSANVVAAVGYANSPQTQSGANIPLGNMGIWQSTDGGSTWTEKLYHYVSGPSGGLDYGSDVVFDPAHSGAIYATLGNYYANSGFVSSAGGVWYSANGGQTWSHFTTGLASGSGVARAALGISSDGNTLYAAFAGQNGDLLNSAVYGTSNAGFSATWSAISVAGEPGMASDDGGYQWWYDLVVAVDPTNANTFYIGGVDIWQATNGASSGCATAPCTYWKNLTNAYGSDPNGAMNAHVHPDQHAIAFLPGSSNYLIGNDGGVWGGTSAGAWTNLNAGGLNITQFYSGAIGETGGAAELYGGAQDNGELQYPGTSVTASTQWNSVFGGDGGATAVDYTDNHVVYEEYVGGNISKSTDGGATWNPATAGINICNSGCDPVNFVAPFAMSQGSNTTLVMGTDKVYRTTNSASTWTAISSSLDDPCTAQSLGYSCSQPLSAVAIAASNSQYVYTGSNYGDVFATTNGGSTWHEVTWQSFSPSGIPTSIAVDPTNPSVAYVTFNSFINGTGKHVYKTTNAGTSWADISATLPDVPFESVVVDPDNHSLVVAGSDAGIFVSQDAGATWANLGSGLPNASVNQVFFSHTGGRLFVATHGRGMWELPLAQFAANPGWVNAAATTPGGSPAAQTIALKNTGFAPLNWTLNSGSVPSWLSVTPSTGTLAPGGTATLTFSFTMPTAPTTPQAYNAQVQFNDPHATNDGFQIPVHVNTLNVSQDWYFAEGFTGRGFDTKIALANPNPSPAHVTITYHLSDGAAPVQHTGITLAPYGRFTDDINNFLAANPATAGNNNGNGYGVATEVHSVDQPVVAERPMYFNGYTVGFDVMGATHLSSSFAFDYLDDTGSHLTIFTVLNPTARDMYANVTLFAAGTGQAYHGQLKVPANARGATDPRQFAPIGLYSGIVTLTSDVEGKTPVDGLVERPMYWTNPKTGFYTGEDVIGAAAPQAEWDFAEGWTNGGGANQGQFRETLYLANPADPASGAPAADATVTIYREDGGAPVTVAVALPAGQQRAVDVNAALPASNSKGNSIKVTATGAPVLAERLMTWDDGATDLLGSPGTANAAYFAESYVGPAFGGFTEILTLENPGDAAAHVTITYLFANDADPSAVPPPITMTWTIPAHARSGFQVNRYLPHDPAHQGFSVQVVADQPILAERVMYFDGGRAGTDAIGYQGEP